MKRKAIQVLLIVLMVCAFASTGMAAGKVITWKVQGFVPAGMLFHEGRESPPTFPSTLKVLAPAAEFTCSVIETLETSSAEDGRMLPPGVLLNINYPPLPREEIKGVLYPEVSSGHMIELGYHRCDDTGHVVPKFYPGVDPEKPHREEGDIRAHLEGYITVSPVRPAWNPPPEVSDHVLKRLNGTRIRY